MAKLTRDQRRRLERAEISLKRVRAFIMRPDIALCRRDRMATTTLHYSRADGTHLSEINREHGSELCFIDTALSELAGLLGSVA